MYLMTVFACNKGLHEGYITNFGSLLIFGITNLLQTEPMVWVVWDRGTLNIQAGVGNLDT